MLYLLMVAWCQMLGISENEYHNVEYPVTIEVRPSIEMYELISIYFNIVEHFVLYSIKFCSNEYQNNHSNNKNTTSIIWKRSNRNESLERGASRVYGLTHVNGICMCTSHSYRIPICMYDRSYTYIETTTHTPYIGFDSEFCNLERELFHTNQHTLTFGKRMAECLCGGVCVATNHIEQRRWREKKGEKNSLFFNVNVIRIALRQIIKWIVGSRVPLFAVVSMFNW